MVNLLFVQQIGKINKGHKPLIKAYYQTAIIIKHNVCFNVSVCLIESILFVLSMGYIWNDRVNITQNE